MRITDYHPKTRHVAAALAVTAALALPFCPAAAKANTLDTDAALESVMSIAEPVQEYDGGIDLQAVTKAPQYKYEMYYLDGMGDTWYNNGTYRYMYIRTDNPDPDFDLIFDQATATYSSSMSSGRYLDVADQGEAGDYLRVPGGYVAKFAFATNSLGSKTLKLYEGSGYDKVLAATFTANFVDYDDAVAEWADDAIARYGGSISNPMKKLEAVCDGLIGEFHYLTNDGTYLLHLVSDPEEPFFVSKRWDSMVSPNMVEYLAKRIGGFEEAHSCYYDYPHGSPDWQATNYACKVTYQGETKLLDACPSSESSEIDRSSVKKINFNNVNSSTFDEPRNYKAVESKGDTAVEHQISIKSDHGTVTVAGSNTATAGEKVSFTIEEAIGYEVTSVKVTTASGMSVSVSGSGTSRSFTMPDEDATITVEYYYRGFDVDFQEPTMTCYVDVDIDGAPAEEGGSSPVIYGGVYAEGQTVNQVVKSYDGYTPSITVVSSSGKSIDFTLSDEKLSFTMPAEGVQVYIKYTKDEEGAETYRVKYNTPDHSEIYFQDKEYAPGEKASFMITPEAGYSVTSIKAVDASGKTVSLEGPHVNSNGWKYYFDMPESDVTITATVERDDTALPITVVGTHCTIVAPKEARPYQEVSISVNPDAGYSTDKIHPVIIDDLGRKLSVFAEGDGYFNFTMPDQPVTITFEAVKAEDGEQGNQGDDSDDNQDGYPMQWFDDVPSDAWYSESVSWAVENDVMHGYEGSDSFGPNDTITRAQMATVLYNVAKNPDVDASIMDEFGDCESGSWYGEAVSWAIQEGIFSGYSDSGMFGPNDPITREQIAVVLWRRAGSPATTVDLTKFPDGSKTSDWAAEAMTWAVQEGIFSGNSVTGELMPTGNLTRAEAATVMMRLLS